MCYYGIFRMPDILLGGGGNVHMGIGYPGCVCMCMCTCERICVCDAYTRMSVHVLS